MLGERGLLIDIARTLGGDAESGGWVKFEADAADTAAAVDTGKERRYHPPVYVSATSWYSLGEKRLGSSPSPAGASIQPTTHLSSSVTSAVGGLDGGADNEICADCVGIRYCA